MAKSETAKEIPMSGKPILLLLHGVGSGDQSGGWKAPLERTLASLGYPDLSGVRVPQGQGRARISV